MWVTLLFVLLLMGKAVGHARPKVKGQRTLSGNPRAATCAAPTVCYFAFT